MAQSNVPVMQSVRAAYQFWRVAWRPAAAALALVTLVSTLQSYWSLRDANGLSLLMFGLLLLVSPIALGALYRAAFADEHPGDPAFKPGRGGLQWGAMEWRLLGASLLLLLFAIILLALFAMLLVIAVVMLAGGSGLSGQASPEEIAASLGVTGVLLLLALFLVIAATFIYLGVRLGLVMPATAVSGKVMVFETWPLTKGQFWPILGAMILVALPTIITAFLVAFVQAQAGDATPSPAVAGGLALLTSIIAGFVQAPLSAGLVAYLYRGLRPAAAPAQTAA